jgi:1-acyl-sn-glycerol-3-phosphate acyltransferase
LPTIPAGKSLSDFMEELENVVETRSEELLVESGYYDRQK